MLTPDGISDPLSFNWACLYSLERNKSKMLHFMEIYLNLGKPVEDFENDSDYLNDEDFLNMLLKSRLNRVDIFQVEETKE